MNRTLQSTHGRRSLRFGYNQAEILDGPSRQLVCAGQTSVDAEGNPQHAGDMRGQMALALDNLEAVLSAADMSLANITRLNIYGHRRGRSHQELRPARRPIRAAQRRSSNDRARCHPKLAIPPLMFEIRGHRRRLKLTPDGSLDTSPESSSLEVVSMDVEQVVMQWTQQRGKHIAILGSTLGGRGRARASAYAVMGTW